MSTDAAVERALPLCIQQPRPPRGTGASGQARQVLLDQDDEIESFLGTLLREGYRAARFDREDASLNSEAT